MTGIWCSFLKEKGFENPGRKHDGQGREYEGRGQEPDRPQESQHFEGLRDHTGRTGVESRSYM